MLICATCGTRILYETNTFSDSNWRKVHQHFSDPIAVSHLVDRPWNTNRISSFYACGVPPKRFVSGGFPRAQNCLYRVIKQILNTTDSLLSRKRSTGVATFLLMTEGNVNMWFPKNDYSRSEALPYWMMVASYRFGTLASPHGLDISSLTQPFDYYTWSSLIGSVFSLCFYFRIVF